MIHLAVAILAFLSALFAPVWLTFILALILVILWEAWEVILLGLLIDLLYLPPEGFFYIPMPATLLAIAVVWATIPLRKRLFLG